MAFANYASGLGDMVDTKTLWFGDVEPWMDESFILGLFSTVSAVQAKIIRDKSSGVPAGYGFVEFSDHQSAKYVLEEFNGKPIPNASGKTFRLNWASYGINERRPEQSNGPEFSIFVGDLSPEVNDYNLQQTFAPHYPSVKSAKVVTDSLTGQSRGYGFVRFSSEEESKRALTEMNGQYCGARPMRLSEATPKRSTQTQPMQTGIPQQIAPDVDQTNTTIFVGGLDSEVTEDQLRNVFSPYGELVYVKIPYGKGCGFVQFTLRSSAERALQDLNGSFVGRNRVRLSWGRSAQARQNPSQPTAVNPQTNFYYPHPHMGMQMQSMNGMTMAGMNAMGGMPAMNSMQYMYNQQQMVHGGAYLQPNSFVQGAATQSYPPTYGQPQMIPSTSHLGYASQSSAGTAMNGNMAASQTAFPSYTPPPSSTSASTSSSTMGGLSSVPSSSSMMSGSSSASLYPSIASLWDTNLDVSLDNTSYLDRRERSVLRLYERRASNRDSLIQMSGEAC